MFPELARRLCSVAIDSWPRPGTVSPDEAAIIGHDGWAFIYKGGNSYYDAYLPGEDDDNLAGDWHDYLTFVENELARHGIPFAFAVVPNKATLMPKHYPLPTGDGPTCRMTRLLDRLDPAQRMVFDRFQGFGAPEALFRRNDSHLTELGNLLLADSLNHLAGGRTDWSHYDLTIVTEHRHAGDLGNKFPAPPIEHLRRLKHPSAGVTITDHPHPERKGHLQGLSYSAANAAAPVDRFVLIFGNSFVERVPSWGSSMPLVSTLRNLRFVWLPWVDLPLAIGLKPDVVIFQTCERFLHRTPQSHGAIFDPARLRTAPREKAFGAAPPVPPPPFEPSVSPTAKDAIMKLSAKSFFRLDAALPEPADIFCGGQWIARVDAGTTSFPLHALVERIDDLRRYGLVARKVTGEIVGDLDANEFLAEFFGDDDLSGKMQDSISPGKWSVYSYHHTGGVVKLRIGIVLPASVPTDARFVVSVNDVTEKTRRVTYDTHFGSGHWFMPAHRVLDLECTFDIVKMPDWARVTLAFDPPHDALNHAFRPNWNLTRLAMLEGLPDDARIHRVASANANRVSFLNGGKTAFERIVSVCAEQGLDVRSGKMKVLDWGVGCGRVVRHFNSDTNAEVTGIDIDSDNIGWCTDNLRGKFLTVGLEPPTSLRSGEFDLVYACSVLSHLTEEAAAVWLKEIARLMAPNGLALLSFNGLSNTAAYLARRPGELRAVLQGQLFDRDINNELQGFIPSATYYRQVFGSDSWWKDMFSRYFRLEGVETCVVSGFQHFAVLRMK